MSDGAFDAEWLTLREPIDHRSRSEELTGRLAAWWARRDASAVLDLGSGTGSNLRYLAHRLPGRQSWTLVDHDSSLLARVGTPPGAVTARTVQADLGAIGPSEVGRAHLVTGSALLDLVSADWLEGLADACTASECAVLFTLTYDGSMAWGSASADPFDAVVRAAVNAHQRRDKGIGTALGPDAATFTDHAFRRRGYDVGVAASTWRLGPDDSELALALVRGWEVAAVEEEPGQADEIGAWAERRRTMLAGGACDLTVGHVDLLALPPVGESGAT